MVEKEQRVKSNWSDPEFLKHYRREYYLQNKTKIKIQIKDYKQQVPKEKRLMWNRTWYVRRKAKILKILGHVTCEKCNEGNLYVITVHHKDGNCKNNQRENLQVLCSNCHLEAEHGKIMYEEAIKKARFDGFSKLWEKVRLDGKNYTSSKNRKRKIPMMEILSLKEGNQTKEVK